MTSPTSETSVGQRLPTIVLTGPISSGKTTLALLIAARLDVPVVTARSAIKRQASDAGASRASLQEIGAALEANTGGQWLVGEVDRTVGRESAAVVDAARTAAQVSALRARSSATLVVHLVAGRDVREARFRARDAPEDAEVAFSEIATSGVELESEGLGAYADLVLDSAQLPPSGLLAAVVNALGSAAPEVT